MKAGSPSLLITQCKLLCPLSSWAWGMGELLAGKGSDLSRLITLLWTPDLLPWSPLDAGEIRLLLTGKPRSTWQPTVTNKNLGSWNLKNLQQPQCLWLRGKERAFSGLSSFPEGCERGVGRGTRSSWLCPHGPSVGPSSWATCCHRGETEAWGPLEGVVIYKSHRVGACNQFW